MQINSVTELLAYRGDLAGLIRNRLDPKLFTTDHNERWKMVFDLEMHLAFLGEAVRCNTPRLFTEYADWTCHLLMNSGGLSDQFYGCLQAINEQIEQSGQGEWRTLAQGYLNAAINQQPPLYSYSGSFLTHDNPHFNLAKGFLDDCIALKRRAAMEKIQSAVASGVPVIDVYLKIITPVLHELGRLWYLNRITIGHEHYCTAVTQMVIAQLSPLIFNDTPKKGHLIALCVAGELHEIGARMLADICEMNGWDTLFLGADVPKVSLIDMLIESNAQVLAISVSLASNLGAAFEVIEAVRNSVDCAETKIMVGGAAFNIDSSLWQKAGADGWAQDGPSALILADKWRV
ncbi:cobalamin-dependent protein [Methylicorpusculum oleiharenae]|uniref:cobalamin B12-binding domain-containing protein n=1 Tax=Methylicorpusculum oleiharenae TaxID=1338687 RepID=UPI001357597F|nr:cobalamin-dependent protein [Methylicorpusculum oleiharenae]MCD2452329.1 cobalamin-dependent protein [Methylicorpusculum oleiharenae]